MPLNERSILGFCRHSLSEDMSRRKTIKPILPISKDLRRQSMGYRDGSRRSFLRAADDLINFCRESQIVDSSGLTSPLMEELICLLR